jgi:hypothetical protein
MSEAPQLGYMLFAVDKKPFCVWGWELRRRNQEYLAGVDHEYFEYLAKAHATQLDGPDAQRAAMALRSAYHHGLETLFTLICAGLQAPGCIAAWILLSRSSDLRSLVAAIQGGHARILNYLDLSEVSWSGLSERINIGSYEDAERTKETKRLFAELWGRLASDFLNEDHIAEYNSMKHGYRARAGGLTLMAGLEHEYGVAPPAEDMQLVGTSQFGSSFPTLVPITDNQREEPNIRLKTTFLNWHPGALAQRLQLIACSINNVVSYLRILGKTDPKNVKFLRPEESSAFQAPWEQSPGLVQATIDIPVQQSEIRAYTREEILTDLQARQTGAA